MEERKDEFELLLEEAQRIVAEHLKKGFRQSRKARREVTRKLGALTEEARRLAAR